ncbi:MAG: hypothetical protein EHM65_01220 [Acidobacteriales bacterium]|nr:MAG: hypothetical protein EHM65_01220 [Terriglobales bacterium]
MSDLADKVRASFDASNRILAAKDAEIERLRGLLRPWADALPPNGELYWQNVKAARAYFSGSTTDQPDAIQQSRTLCDNPDAAP